MEPRISFVTLGVTDLERSIRFYGDGLRLPRLPSPAKASFFDLGPTRLALEQAEQRKQQKRYDDPDGEIPEIIHSGPLGEMALRPKTGRFGRG